MLLPSKALKMIEKLKVNSLLLIISSVKEAEALNIYQDAHVAKSKLSFHSQISEPLDNERKDHSLF